MIQIEKELQSGGIKERCKRKIRGLVRVPGSRPPPTPVPPDLQEVGICTVHRSSDDSSVDVPMKS